MSREVNFPATDTCPDRPGYRIVPKVAERRSTDAHDVICTSIRCTHERRRCRKCRLPDCVHTLDGGVCVPCRLRIRDTSGAESLGPGDLAHVFGSSGIELIETIGEPQPGRRGRR